MTVNMGTTDVTTERSSDAADPERLRDNDTHRSCSIYGQTQADASFINIKAHFLLTVCSHLVLTSIRTEEHTSTVNEYSQPLSASGDVSGHRVHPQAVAVHRVPQAPAQSGACLCTSPAR